MKRSLLAVILFCTIAILPAAWPQPVSAQQAASILIWPINPVIEADARAGALWLENKGRTPATLQVRIFAWGQQDGRDAYAEQDEILGSPPIVTIQPGERQLVRLTRIAPPPLEAERPYRIVVDEIPTSDASAPASAAVSFRMRYSLPLFSYAASRRETKDGPTRPAPQIAWQVGSDTDGRFLEVHNRGGGHARLTDVAFSDGQQQWPMAEGLLGYVLPGMSMRWPLAADVRDGAMLIATVNGTADTRIERQPE